MPKFVVFCPYFGQIPTFQYPYALMVAVINSSRAVIM